MKMTHITVTMSHKVFLGGYETIEPSVSITAELEAGDIIDDVRRLIANEVQKQWNKEALEEMRIVHKRRNGGQLPENDKVPELMTALKMMAKPTEDVPK